MGDRIGRVVALTLWADEDASLDLELVDLAAHRVDAERAHLPGRLAHGRAAHVLAPHERDVGAEAVHEHVDQPAPVLVLLGRHAGEHLGAVGILVAQAVGVVGEDAAVLLLAADGQRQDLAFGQVSESSHGRTLAIAAVTIKPVP